MWRRTAERYGRWTEARVAGAGRGHRPSPFTGQPATMADRTFQDYQDFLATLGGTVGPALACAGGQLLRSVFLLQLAWFGSPLDVRVLLLTAGPSGQRGSWRVCSQP
jgi:hypothetical protein